MDSSAAAQADSSPVLIPRLKVDTTHVREEEGPNPDTVFHQYVQTCKDTFRLDTTVLYKEKNIHITFLHYSTNDSMIHLPRKYMQPYHLAAFTTSNFRSSLRISANDSLLLDTLIDKTFFNVFEFEELRERGTLLFPAFRWTPEGMTIDYSYTIPLTDVGTAASLDYTYYGELKVRKDN